MAYISAGSNDPANPRLESNLKAIRTRANAVRTVVIAPIAPRPRSIVCSIDPNCVTFHPARDNVHPRSLKELHDGSLRHP